MLADLTRQLSAAGLAQGLRATLARRPTALRERPSNLTGGGSRVTCWNDLSRRQPTTYLVPCRELVVSLQSVTTAMGMATLLGIGIPMAYERVSANWEVKAPLHSPRTPPANIDSKCPNKLDFFFKEAL